MADLNKGFLNTEIEEGDRDFFEAFLGRKYFRNIENSCTQTFKSLVWGY